MGWWYWHLAGMTTPAVAAAIDHFGATRPLRYEDVTASAPGTTEGAGLATA